jgi:hypothetical protein
MKMQIFATSDKVNPNTENIRGRKGPLDCVRRGSHIF